MLTPLSDTLPLEIVHRLQRLRRARGYTLQEVYDATGVHIARLEANKTNMRVATLAVLCQYYEISLADFFQGL